MLKAISLVILTALITIVATVGFMGYYITKNNPYNFKACMISSFLNSSAPIVENIEDKAVQPEVASDKNPLLSAEQETMLEKAGINPGSLPASISPSMEACFVEKLGQKRVDEIKAGDFPGLYEIYKAKACLN